MELNKDGLPAVFKRILDRRADQPADFIEVNEEGLLAIVKRMLDRQPSSPMESPKKCRRQSTAMSATADIAEPKRSRISMKTSSVQAKAKGKGKGNAEAKKTRAATGGICHWAKGKGKAKGKATPMHRLFVSP